MPVTVAEAFVTLRPDMSKFKGEVGGFLASNARTLAVAAAAVGTAAAGGLLAVVNPARAVEQQMNILQNVTRANAGEMQAMADLARELGADLTLPATSSRDAAVAMTELAKGGLGVTDVLGATKGVLQLTAAGALETGRAAEITATALNNFRLAGDQATRVADLLAGAAQSASGEVPDMAEALEAVGSIARESGVSIDDTVAAIALLAKNGTIGAEAGYQLRNMLLQLTPAAGASTKMMEAVGFSAFDAAGNMKPLEQVIQDLTDVTANMTQEARVAFLDQIFGTRGGVAVLNLLKETSGGLREMRGELSAGGQAADAAAARNKGLTGAIDGFKSAIETAAIDLGSKLLPQLTGFVRGAAEAVNGLHTLGPAIMLIAEGAVIGFGQARDAVAGFFGFIQEHSVLAIAAILGVGTAIAIALGPGSIALLAIAATIGALVGFNTKWVEVFAALPPPVLAAMTTIVQELGGFIDAFGTVVNIVIEGLNKVREAANLLAKGVVGAKIGTLIAAGDMEGAAAAQEQLKNLAQFEDIPKLPENLSETIADTLNQNRLFAERQKEAAEQLFHGRTREQLLGEEGETETDAAAAAAEAFRQKMAALAATGGGAKTTLDDLRASMSDAKEPMSELAKAAKDMADRIKAAADRIIEQQTSDVVKAFFEALQEGTDPDAAIAKVRAKQALDDKQWEVVAAALREKLHIPVVDEYRGMWEEMRAVQGEQGNNFLNEQREELRQRLASIGRLLPNGVLTPQPGQTANTYNINVAVPVDAAGRINTKELTDAIVDATVVARERAPLAEAR